MPRRAHIPAAALLLATLAAAPLAARELSWRAIDVVARLEADGRLAVAETQAMVFTGDWNGGERRFRVALGQSVEVERIVRIDPASGAETELVRGDLDEVDHWDWTDGSTVRWRSRLPSDPPFDSTEIDYRLEMVYRGILRHEGERGYLLDHDFLFADRDGAVERFTWALELAPGWEAVGAEPARQEAGPLEPGRGFVVTRHLRWTGAGEPAEAAPAKLPVAARWGALGLLAVVALERFLAWRRRDRALGRFEPLVPPESIDRAWLEQRVFALPPEVVGAAWDRSIGSAEVAATLARLVAAGQLESRVEKRGSWIFSRQVLHLKRRVPVSEIDDGARPLVQALFPSGEETDTDSLRAHYRSSGFDPASKLKANLDRRVAALRGFAPGSPKPAWKPTGLLLAGGFAVALAGALTQPAGWTGIFLCAMLLVASLPGTIAAAVAQGRVGTPRGALAVVLASLLVQGVLLAMFALFAPGFPGLALAGSTLVACATARAYFNLIATRESAEALARRRELAAGRAYFRRELAREQPALEDRWLPWLVAFGLAPEIDRWFGAYGAATSGLAGTSTSSFGGSGSGGGWSGGGGAFGGAGATASFASAVSVMAAGVPAPSSSGSSGGGGGGGSSGGGGGGGW